MYVCWSVKGGSGTTVFASALALALAERHGSATIVDFGGDVPSVLGLAEPGGFGVRDWFASGASDPHDLHSLAISATSHLRLVPAGSPASFDTATMHVLGDAFPNEQLVVDCGSIQPDDDLRRGAHADWLVVRPCYLALRRAARLSMRPGGVVLVTEEGRSLTSRDVVAVTGAPVVAEVRARSEVARSVDAGLLATRLPASLSRDIDVLF